MKIIVGLLIVTLVSAVRADTIVLKDGSRLEGDVKKSDQGYVVVSASGKVTTVTSDAVQAIELGAGKSDAATAESNLQSLRRSVEALTSAQQAVDRFKRFIDLNKTTPAATEAKKDLAVWQDRVDRGLIKVGTRWVTPTERDAFANEAGTIVQQAIELMHQGRNRDAEPVLQHALDDDPHNAAALFLRGVLLFQQEQIPAARKAFEAANAVNPGHAPTLNDLAVILWRQNLTMLSLKFYDESLICAPVNKTLLDNAAEALAALTDEQRKNTVAVKLYHLFTDQDSQLQAEMAKTGWYRWGSTWVDQATLDRLKAAEKDIQTKLDANAADQETAKTKISADQATVTANTTSMQQMESQTYTRDPQGRVFQVPYPAIYYQMQADNQRLNAEIATEQGKLQSLRSEAKQIQSDLPVPRYTGTQRLIGVEGVPNPNPNAGDSPTTEASTTAPPTTAPTPDATPTATTPAPSPAPVAAPPPPATAPVVGESPFPSAPIGP